MTKAVFRKNEGAFWAASEEAHAMLRSIKNGKDVMIDVRIPRNLAQHRLLFAVLNKVCESGAWAYDIDGLLHFIKWKLGHVEVMTVNGQAITRVKSISFESMDEPTFRLFFERAVHLICREITGEALRAEIIEMVDGPYKEALRRNAA